MDVSFQSDEECLDMTPEGMPPTAQRFEMGGATRRIKFSAETGDRRIHDIGSRIKTNPPDPLQQERVREHFPLVVQKEFEQGPLTGLQGHDLVEDPDLAPKGIQHPPGRNRR
jgi:hypothetical protein